MDKRVAPERRRANAGASAAQEQDGRPLRQIGQGPNGGRPNAAHRPAVSHGRAMRASPSTPAQPGRADVHRTAAKRRRMRRRAIWREARIWMVTLALTLLVALGVRAYVFELVRVEGPSMNPTLASGELVLVTKFDYIFSAPARNDVVVCRFPNREGTFIKRVIGLPGDTVLIKDGRTYINDELQAESFVSYPAEEDYGPVLIGDGQYLVMGDNRAISHDGRADDVGTLRSDCLLGRARSVVYPLSETRGIGP